MHRNIRIVGKERQVLDIGKFVLGLLGVAAQLQADGGPRADDVRPAAGVPDPDDRESA